MKKLAVAAIIFISCYTAAFADYDSDLKAGNIAFSHREFETALKFYEKAYAQKQTRELKDYIAETTVKMAEKRVEEKKYPGTDDVPKNIFSINVYMLIMGELDVKYLRSLGIFSSISLGFKYGWKGIGVNFGLDSWSYEAGQIDFDWYPLGYSPQGPYTGVGAGFGYLQGVASYTPMYGIPQTEPYHTLLWRMDIHGGYRLIINRMFVLNAMLGATSPGTNTEIRVDVDLGYAF